MRITMSARAVVAAGLPFDRRDETYADASVALDEIRDLRIAGEPTVLRVEARGGSKEERDLVVGDWLFDVGWIVPRRVPSPRWQYGPAAETWSRQRPWVEAWETCERPVWMLFEASRVGIDHRRLVRSACACVRTVLDAIPATEDRPREALEAAEAWARDRGSPDDAMRAASRAFVASAALTDRWARSAAAAAANVAYSVYGQSKADVLAQVPEYVWRASRGAGRHTLRELVRLVRQEVPTLLILRQVAE